MKTLLSGRTNTSAAPFACSVVAIATMTLLGGCTPKYYVQRGPCPVCEPAPKSYVVLIPSPDGTVGEVVVKGEKGEQTLKNAGQAALVDGQALQVDDKQIKQDFGSTMAALPTIPVRFVLNFSSGITLSPASAALLPKIIAEAEARPAVDVSVTGHTDTLQTFEYNEKLGLRRATKVADQLREQGLKANSLSIESDGERNPLVPTPDNTFEPKNRRVEVSVR